MKTSLIILAQTRHGSKNILPLSNWGNELFPLCVLLQWLTKELSPQCKASLHSDPSGAMLSQAYGITITGGKQSEDLFHYGYEMHISLCPMQMCWAYNVRELDYNTKAWWMLVFLKVLPVLYQIFKTKLCSCQFVVARPKWPGDPFYRAHTCIILSGKKNPRKYSQDKDWPHPILCCECSLPPTISGE